MKEITKETYLQWYSDMNLWRKFEDKCQSLYLKQKIRGFLHLYNGQEALMAGVIHSIQVGKDSLITAYRCHVHAIALGVHPNNAMAELCGKVTGTSKGNGGSMHIFSKEHKFYGGHGIVGGQIPLGAGIAFADKYFDRDAVNLTFMGDGAVRQGSLHETFNMAMNWQLPVVFICENNQYAMGTSVKRTANHEEIHLLAEGYKMPHAAVDGMDPVKVAEAVYEAVERARRGDGPTFLEIRTYRFKGHSISDAQAYRTKEEVNFYKENRDPITQVAKKILTEGWATEEELEAIADKAQQTVEDAVTFAENSDYPPVSQIYDSVYEEANYPFVDLVEKENFGL